MDEKRLQALLEQVKEEIDNSKNVDEKGKALLERTRADIESLLDKKKHKSTTSQPDTTSRFEETIAYLEATHPQLTIMMTDLLDILSNAGI